MKRILVIDDSPDILDLVQRALKAQGWEALTARTGEEGLARAHTECPDLILCDIRLPGIDGYEVLKRVRATPETVTTPFIFLSGLGDKPAVRQGMNLGADDYLQKPFIMAEMISAVEARFAKQDELLKRAEARLQDLRKSLTLALPHELVTPLNSILGFSSLLQDPGLPGNEVQECAQHIQEAASRLQRVIENFIFYAQLELVSSDPARLQSFRGELCDDTAALLEQSARKMARKRNRESDLRLKLSPARAAIAEKHLDRLLRELVDNALKFSVPGTPVSVESDLNNGALEIRVKDHGRGMSPQQVREVAPHMQFERKLYEQQGTGLGLAIARRLAELHDGALWIESVPMEFTVVHVKLPSNVSAA